MGVNFSHSIRRTPDGKISPFFEKLQRLAATNHIDIGSLTLGSAQDKDFQAAGSYEDPGNPETDPVAAGAAFYSVKRPSSSPNLSYVEENADEWAVEKATGNLLHNSSNDLFGLRPFSMGLVPPKPALPVIPFAPPQQQAASLSDMAERLAGLDARIGRLGQHIGAMGVELDIRVLSRLVAEGIANSTSITRTGSSGYDGRQRALPPTGRYPTQH